MGNGLIGLAPCIAASWVEWLSQPANWWVILQVAGGLGFVIFVHELGHFLVAKACGVKCEKFYLGFDVGGAKLCSFTWGETEYGIGALPLGGYVKMLGQDDNPAAAASEAERARLSGDLPPEPTAGPHPAWDPRSYPAQSVPKRMAIISAGVIMNVIFAVLLASWAFGLGVREMTCEVSSVRPGGAAWRAGLRTGDEITAIGGRKDPIFNDLRHGVTVGSVAKGIDFTVRRPSDDTTRTVLLKPDTDLGAPTIGVTNPLSLTLPADLRKGLVGGAADAAPALAGGDTIKAVDGTAVASYAELIAALSRATSKPVTLTVERRPQDEKAVAQTEAISIELPPQPVRTTGLVMTPRTISAVQADSPAAAAGLQAGDRVVSVDGEPIGDPLTLDARLAARAGQTVRLTIGREGAADRTVEITPRDVTWIDNEANWPASPASISSLGIVLVVDSVVAAVEPGSPAAAAGIAVGDKVVRARFIDPDTKPEEPDDGVELSEQAPNWVAVAAVLQRVPADTILRLTVESAAGRHDVDLAAVAAADRFVVDRGLVFDPIYKTVRAGSVGAALARGSRKAMEDLSLVSSFLQKLTSNQISPRLLGGPIEIAKQAGRSAQEGFGRLLLFLTMLSANLAVVNFLPIPVLDGGHMVFLLYELIRGKPPSENVVAVLSYLGLALILTLMMFVFGLDLGLIPRR
ncbi:MAG: site-2 protease family protein [Pirellulales bacterium]